MPVPLLRDRLASLPLVLSGPLLRRVEPVGVTVWLALKEARKVTLRVYAGDAGNAGVNQIQEGTSSTRPLGSALHVVAVTSGGTALSWGTRYSYQLTFGPHGTGTTPVPESSPTLFSSGIVAAGATGEATAKGILLYGAGAPTLPTFVLPPADLNLLRLVHASCRKPHAEGRDAMQALDVLIREALQGRGQRPHQLFLTGDQIYADDVADALLLMLTDAGDTLIGRDPPEALPIGGAAGQPARSLRPGTRQALVKVQAKFTSTHAKSHLLSLGEFLAMYLFVWSDVLWPPALPTFADVDPARAAVLARGPVAGTEAQFNDAVGHSIDFTVQMDRLAPYVQNLRAVRRILAHVPTYMMFDDHEVTDDWYLTFAWVRDALAKPLGKRVIQNGLAAFAVCQAWGNTPDRFRAGQPGDALLTALEQWDGTEGHPKYGEIGQRVGIPTLEAQFQRLVRPAGALDWHFVLNGPRHQVLVLDTRTYRSFPGLQDDPPSLLTGPALALQLTPTNAAGQPLPPPPPDGVLVVLAPPPIVDVPFSEFGKSQVSHTTGDREIWGFQPDSFESLLAALAGRFSRIVLLSGDVHYGYTVRVEYWADNPYGAAGQARAAVMASLTSSALKNQSSELPAPTTIFHTNGYRPHRNVLPETWDRLGWNQPPGQDLVVGTQAEGALFWREFRPWVLRTSPAVLEAGELPSGSRITRAPDWRYRVHFLLADAELVSARGFSPRPVSRPARDTARDQALHEYLKASLNHQDVEGRWGNGKEVVGVNNMGDVTFSWQATRKAVVHQLWWWLEGPPDPFPLSKWTVPLDPVPRPAPVGLVP
jgi:hypothetical protein